MPRAVPHAVLLRASTVSPAWAPIASPDTTSSTRRLICLPAAVQSSRATPDATVGFFCQIRPCALSGRRRAGSERRCCYTLGLIQCQFRTAHRFGQSSSCHIMKSAARLYGRFHQGACLRSTVRESCCARLLRLLVDCEQTTHFGGNILQEVTGC